jgi:hypothetical protein
MRVCLWPPAQPAAAIPFECVLNCVGASFPALKTDSFVSKCVSFQGAPLSSGQSPRFRPPLGPYRRVAQLLRTIFPNASQRVSGFESGPNPSAPPAAQKNRQSTCNWEKRNLQFCRSVNDSTESSDAAWWWMQSSIKANPSRGGDAKLWALNRPEGGTDKAARLPKGWTGPVSTLGAPGFRKEARIFFARCFNHPD